MPAAAGLVPEVPLADVDLDVFWQFVEKPSAVIPGRREAADPESRKAGNPDVLDSGFAPFGAPRNDGPEFFSSLLNRTDVAGTPAGRVIRPPAVGTPHHATTTEARRAG